MMDELENYREEIDSIDLQILSLLADRCKVAESIAEYKKSHNIPVLQKRRWEELLSRLMNVGESRGIPPGTIKHIWEEIHTLSLAKENTIIHNT